MFSRCHAFTRCAYKQSIDEEERECCSLLYPVFTENGFCFAFNLNYTANDCPWYYRINQMTSKLSHEIIYSR